MWQAKVTSNNLTRMSIYFCQILLMWTVAAGRHGTDILQRPDDVIGAKCGDELKMTCIAKASGQQRKGQTKTPDIEWWYWDSEAMTSKPGKLIELDREGRVAVHIEEFYVVRSTLIIKDAEKVDEGVYQCRASNSPNRFKENVNVYQHWRIEEAPIRDLKCGEDTTTISTSSTTTSTVNIIPSQSYNRSKIDDIIVATVKSTTTQTPQKSLATPPSRKSKTARNFIKRHPRRTTSPSNSGGRSSGSALFRRHKEWFYVIITAVLLTLTLYLSS
ncbi:uncharacterized protein LOC143459051 isoform X1 [Clavelina lepadiformis]|uniref:uncharacterized protein LOC143459051 isoform X1 n=2 Tax=Clavelina lepadiformis TaxID=159417 RepID=UPI0040433E98